ARAAATAARRPIRIRPNQGEAFETVNVQRQYVALILQQHYSGLGHAPGHLSLRLVIYWPNLRRTIEEPEAHHHSQDTANFVVDCRVADLTLLHGSQERLTKVFVPGHLYIETIVGRLDRAVCRSPI